MAKNIDTTGSPLSYTGSKVYGQDSSGNPGFLYYSHFSDGTYLFPGITFSSSQNSGLYKTTSGIGISVEGVTIARFYKTFIGLDKGLILQNTSGTEVDFQGVSNTTISTTSSIDFNINSGGLTPGSYTFRIGYGGNIPLYVFHDFGVMQLGGDSATPINQEIKSADNTTQGAGADLLVKCGESFGTNASAATLRLRSGQSTGSGAGGSIIFQATRPGSSGTVANSPVDVASITPAGNLLLSGESINVATSKTPASATATGTAGTIVWDTNYIYVCTATNTWKRSALATW